jgi:transaldolase
MKATQALRDLESSLWLDNITRGLLQHYIEDFSVAGLTSNLTIFDHALKNGNDYDGAIGQKLAEGKSGEALFFFSLRAKTYSKPQICSDQFTRYLRVSLEVSPLLSHDTAKTLAAARALYAPAATLIYLLKLPVRRKACRRLKRAVFAGFR